MNDTPKITTTQTLRDEYKHKRMIELLNAEIEQLQHDVNHLVETSQRYHTVIEQATTSHKKEYYSKKLKKNNTLLYVALRNLDQHVEVHKLATAPAQEQTDVN